MLQCVAGMCTKRRHVRLLCLLGTSCAVSPSAATGGDLRVRERILGQEKLLRVLYICKRKIENKKQPLAG